MLAHNILSSRFNELCTFPWMHPVIVHLPRKNTPRTVWYSIWHYPSPITKQEPQQTNKEKNPLYTTQTEQIKLKRRKKERIGQWWWLADFSPWIKGVIAWTVPNTARAFRVECKLNIHPLTSECMRKMLPLIQTPRKIQVTLWVSFIEPLGSELSCQSVSD